MKKLIIALGFASFAVVANAQSAASAGLTVAKMRSELTGPAAVGVCVRDVTRAAPQISITSASNYCGCALNEIASYVTQPGLERAFAEVMRRGGGYEEGFKAGKSYIEGLIGPAEQQRIIQRCGSHLR